MMQRAPSELTGILRAFSNAIVMVLKRMQKGLFCIHGDGIFKDSGATIAIVIPRIKADTAVAA